MLAAIDIGNTFAKLGLFNNNELLEFKKDKLLVIKKYLLKKKIKRVILVSVVHNADHLKKTFSEIDELQILDVNTILPIKNKYESKDTLGYDRIAAVVGAFFKFPEQNSLVIDMGTAIKYDFISAEGEFSGGMIGPGLKMRFKALHTFTKKLPLIEPQTYPALIGKNTKEAMESGVINGMIAEVNGVIDQFKDPVNVILTGGDYEFFESKLKSPYFAAPFLVLEGLNRIFSFNAQK